MSINRELSQLASFIDVQESNNFIGISTGGTYTVGIGTSSVTISSNGTITAPLFLGATGSSLIDHIDLQDEGSLVGTGFTTLNFVGAAVTITQGITGVATITVDSAVVGGEDGAVQFASGGTLTGISTLLFADSTNYRVGIGSSSPTAKLDVNGTLNVSGLSTFQDNVFLGNNDKLTFGDSGDELQIYHTGSLSYISDQGPGSLRILSNQLRIRNHLDNAELAKFVAGGRVELYYNNSVKFETVGGGVSISSGTASTATIYGPGNLIIDPAPVDDNGGIVRIKGDLYVDGTTTEINSTTLTIDDLNVVVASGATNGLTADGAGLSVAGAGATIKYNYNGGGANEQWVFNKAPYYNTDRLLTTADEGSGNGIDADTLDGEQGTYYLDYSNFSGIATDSSLLDGLDSTQFLRSDAADIKTSGDLRFDDSVKAAFGTDDDLKIYSNNVHSYISNYAGQLMIEQEVSGGYINIRNDNGSGSQTDYIVAHGGSGEVRLYHFGTQKLATKSNGIDVTGHTETDTLNVSGLTTFQGDVSFTSDAEFDDNVRIHFGTDNDFDIYHVGTHAYLQNDTGDIMIVNGADGRDVNIMTDNGSGGTTNYFRADGSSGEVQLYHFGTKKFATKSTGIDVTGHTETDTLNVSGVSTFTDNVSFGSTATFGDDDRLRFGDGNDLQIYHDGDNSYIEDTGTGRLIIRGSSNVDIRDTLGNTHARFKEGSSNNSRVELYYDNSKKFETTGYGVTITGGINVSGVATATDFNSASDENLKTNIRTIEDPLAKVVQIRGVNFDWKETQRPALGVIAQEVEKVLPELVTDNGTKTVNYNGLIGLLIETVKEQQKQINTLSERLSKLE